MFSPNWQPGVPKYNWVNWQWAGFTNNNKHRHSGPDAHFQRRITDCSIVFQINKYVNLTCFLNVCKHIMVFLCFSRVKILHTAPLKRVSPLAQVCVCTLKLCPVHSHISPCSCLDINYFHTWIKLKSYQPIRFFYD